jgi:hypothetical protein
MQVRCQADGLSAVEVVRRMVAQYGMSAALARQLYSGFGAAAAFSMLVGSVHWLSFCAAKRAALAALPASSASDSGSDSAGGAILAPVAVGGGLVAATTTTTTTTTLHTSSSHQPHEETTVKTPSSSGQDNAAGSCYNVVQPSTVHVWLYLEHISIASLDCGCSNPCVSYGT